MVTKKRKKAAKKSPRRKAQTNEVTAYHLKITLVGCEPSVWRRFVVPSYISLGSLHTVVQAVMDWTNSHLHRFEADGRQISDPAFELDEFEGAEPTVDEHSLELGHIVPNVGDTILYEYDLGDSWMHEIVVESIKAPPAYAPPIWCLDGGGKCPPDDCGGIGGYSELLDAIADSKHPEHEQMLEWAGGIIDPTAFDARAVNRELARWVLSTE